MILLQVVFKTFLLVSGFQQLDHHGIHWFIFLHTFVIEFFIFLNLEVCSFKSLKMLTMISVHVFCSPHFSSPSVAPIPSIRGNLRTSHSSLLLSSLALMTLFFLFGCILDGSYRHVFESANLYSTLSNLPLILCTASFSSKGFVSRYPYFYIACSIF